MVQKKMSECTAEKATNLKEDGDPQSRSAKAAAKAAAGLFRGVVDFLLTVQEALRHNRKLPASALKSPESEAQEKEETASGASQEKTQEIDPPVVVLIQGKPGSGKTTLLDLFCREVPAPLFRYRFTEGWLDPLQPLRSLLKALQHALPPAAWDSLTQRFNWLLSPLLSPTDLHGPEAPVPEVDSPERYFVGWTRFLVEAARRVPFVAVFEDIHLADPSFVTFLGFLGRALRSARNPGRILQPELRKLPSEREDTENPPRLLLLASCLPPGSAADSVSKELAELTAESFAAVCKVPSLTRAYLGRIFSAAGFPKSGNGTSSKLLELVGGNPLEATLLVRTLLASGNGEPEALQAGELLVKAQEIAEAGIVPTALRALHAPAQRLLAALATVRRPVPEDRLGSLRLEDLGLLGSEEIPQAVSELKAQGLVREEAEGLYPTSSTIAAEAQQLLTHAERSKLHDRLSEQIAGEGPLAGARAFAYFQHAVRGSDPNAALDAGLQAAAFLERCFAYRRSLVVLYNLAGLLQAKDPADPRLLEVRKAIVRLEERIGRDNAAKQNLKRILSETPPELLTENERADLMVRLACIYRRQGRFSRTLKVLGRAFSRNLSPETTARIYAALAETRLQRGEAKRALNYCLRALSLLSEQSPPESALRLRCLLAAVYAFQGDYALAADTLLKALENCPEAELPAQGRSILDQLGGIYRENGNYFRAARYLYRALEAKKEVHDVAGLAETYTALGDVYARSGNFAKAIEQQRRAAEIREVLGDWRGLGCNLVNLGSAFLRLGLLRDAIESLRSAVNVAQRSGRTEDLVAAFVSLAEAYLFLGDIKEAESYLRQTTILAQEYNLRFYEARALQLTGRIAAMRRNWDKALPTLQKAQELYSKAGSRLNELETKLDLAAAAYEREQYDEAVKLATQAQVQAEELRAPALAARCMLVRGNAYRHLSSGDPGKWRECLNRALEIARSVADIHLHFDILYSLGKAYHDEQAFEAADNQYRKAQEILERIAATLKEQDATRFWNDKRRWVFREDYRRLIRESGGRVPSVVERVDASPGAAEVPPAAYEDLLAKVERVNSFTTHENFHGQVLGLAMDLARAERGCLIQVEEDTWRYAAFRGVRPEAFAGSLSYVETLFRQVIRQGKTLETSGRDEEEKYGHRAGLAGLRDRKAILVPIRSGEQTFGVLYLDRSNDGGGFRPGARRLLEQFARHTAVAWNNRKTFLQAATYSGTPFLVESYFAHLVKEAVDQQRRGGNTVALLGIAVGPALRRLDGELVRELKEAIGRDRRVGVIGDRVMVVLLREGGSTKELKAVAQTILTRVRRLVDVEDHELLVPENLDEQVAWWLNHLRDRLNPAGDLVNDMQRLVHSRLALREAKKLLEKHVIMRALKQAHGNITRAAQALGIHRPQLSQLVRKYDLKREDFLTTLGQNS